ncbi:hypothetical protein Nepgr_026082 [Nepenthes gracilis]|uniref:ubiquitinyl hydrolase 1 n=1 Tax=Nepenthes gracilis TaxID=150966 RepID=A0AAD3Y1R3_NEPGR|nr:hypothetical protein Nepgr_026082 [Nepenthes gracilis]
MLEPREADIPAFFLVLVVLPLVTYILLGKWGEVSKRKLRISLLAKLAVEESLGAEEMATASVIPHVSPPKIVFHECARCHGPATTRCSRCKSVRYCSGKCQIIHWRQGHKEECWSPQSFSSSLKPTFIEELGHAQALSKEDLYPLYFSHPPLENASSDVKYPSRDPSASAAAISLMETPKMPMLERKTAEKQVPHKSTREMDTSETNSAEDISSSVAASSNSCCINSVKKAHMRHKLRGSDSVNPGDGFSVMNDFGNPTKLSHGNAYLNKEKNGLVSDEPIRMGDVNRAEGGNGMTTMRFMKMIDLKRSPKVTKKDILEVHGDSRKKVKMLFPYKEFTKFFQYEIPDLAPRGLLNCGNSCYANAVLQCLSCTKPLVVYLLKRTHSRTCCIKSWCLLCELEQHVMMLRESGGPLSPSRILLHMRSINCQIGDGSQEDAHEFLRLLVTSMQSICLEELGGEKQVDPSLQETTFIKHTFGGCLQSKVKCLKCYHESEQYENIMDLTLEIFGWVESLEDALTQFTTPEDLDGENMYRCGRCASYVRARKQLSIDEAPNVLTIVLKRFQEGSYGKINKFVTFPDMLDMIPFMTGTHDIPPLYVLYAVVVHMDTLNASFSGHYVSYVKDLQGNWLRIDDSEVQPVSMSQVMAEGAYILFYIRSFPRPLGACVKTSAQQQSPPVKHHAAHKSSRPGVSLRPPTHSRPETFMGYTNHTSDEILRSANKRFSPMMETYAEPIGGEFSDATSSDWSLFTSSDEASFTTESTSDSFSTADYADPYNIDPVTSLFSMLYEQERACQRTVSCTLSSGSRPCTRFAYEEKGFVFDSNESYLSSNPLNEVPRGGNLRQVSVPPEASRGRKYCELAKYGGNREDKFLRTLTRLKH